MRDCFQKNDLSIRLVSKIRPYISGKNALASIENTVFHDRLNMWLVLKNCFKHTACIENTALHDRLFVWLVLKISFNHTASIENTALHDRLYV